MLNRFIKPTGLSGGAIVWSCAVLVLAAAPRMMASVPSAVASSQIQYVTGMTDPTKVVVDGSGNIFVTDNGAGTLYEIPAGTTTLKTILTGLGGPHGLAVDSFGDVFVSSGYNGNVWFIPNLNGTLNVSAKIDLSSAYGFGGLDGYYSSFSDIAVDASGNAYLSVNYCGSCSSSESAIFVVKTSGPTTTAATIGTAGSAKVFLASLPGGKYAINMAVDTSGHLYYADGANVYVASTTSGTPTPVTIGSGFVSPQGVTVNSTGDLFVSDNSTQLLSIIPNESGALNPADQYGLCQPVNIEYGVGFDAAGNIYSGDGYATGSVWKTTLGAVSLGSSAVGTTSANATMSFVFNTAQTPASIAVVQGTGSASEFVNIFGGSCSGGAAYAVGKTCTVQVTMTPASTGLRTGAVVLLSAANKAIATAYLSGTGTGAGLTVDPGVQTALTAKSAWQAPSAVALDASGNVYVADSLANAVQVISAAGTATIGSGLSAPSGVAVDAAGNVFIADTGHNRIVEVPNENGTLNTADQVAVVSSGLSSPLGIAVGPTGAVYVADSGNARVLALQTYAGAGLVRQSTIGSGFQNPVGVATDSAGNVYVVDKKANQISVVSASTGVQSTALTGLNAPTNISIDASGSAYVVNSGSKSLLRIANVSGSLNATTQLTLGTGLVTPTGVAVNGAGNVAISDSGAPGAFTLVRTTGAMSFGSVNEGLSSSAQTLTLTSAGTATATLGATAYTASGNTSSFTVTAAAINGCANGASLTVGATCGYSAVFTPVATGSLSEKLTFSSNAVNAGSVSAVLSGTGTNLSPTTTTLVQVSPAPPANPAYGQAVTVSATVVSTKAGFTPTGKVTFSVDGIAQNPVVLSTASPYTAAITLPALSLTAGTHVINASYGGDANNASSSATTALIVIIAKATSTTAASVYIGTNPNTPTIAQVPGSPFTFVVYTASTTQGTPTGTVNLELAGTTTVVASATLGTATPVTCPSGFVCAAISYAPPATGQYQVAYAGDVNFAGSTSQAVTVSVRNQGYDLSMSNSTPTVPAGQSLSIPITVTSVSGYGGSVTVGALNLATNAATNACSALPAYMTCTFSPGVVSLSGGLYPASNEVQTMMLTLNTDVPPAEPFPYPAILWPGGLGSFAALALARKRRRAAGGWRLMALVAGAVFSSLALGLGGCGSGTTTYTTPKGTTSMTLTLSGTPVTGAATVSNPNITNTITFQLTVQ